MKLVPLAKAVPPVAAEYQFTVPAEAVAARVTGPELHLAAGVVPEIAGIVLTVTTVAGDIALWQEFTSVTLTV